MGSARPLLHVGPWPGPSWLWQQGQVPGLHQGCGLRQGCSRGKRPGWPQGSAGHITRAAATILYRLLLGWALKNSPAWETRPQLEWGVGSPEPTGCSWPWRRQGGPPRALEVAGSLHCTAVLRVADGSRGDCRQRLTLGPLPREQTPAAGLRALAVRPHGAGCGLTGLPGVCARVRVTMGVCSQPRPLAARLSGTHMCPACLRVGGQGPRCPGSWNTLGSLQPQLQAQPNTGRFLPGCAYLCPVGDTMGPE